MKFMCKMHIYFEYVSLIFGIVLFTEVYSCTQTVAQHKREGDSLTLQFQAVKSVTSGFLINNQIISPTDDVLITLLYKNGNFVRMSNCSGCTFTGNTDTGDMSARLDNLQSSAKGTYLKLVDGKVNDCIRVFILGVPVKPAITADKDPIVGESITLTCSSSSTTTPSDHGLSRTYNWRVNGTDNSTDSRYSYSVSKKILMISNVRKEDANKRFTCTATENVSNGYTSTRSGTFSPNVLYGPESLSFIPSNTIYEETENSQLGPITCNANCNPPCSFKWRKVAQGTVISNTAVIDLDGLTTSEAGIYRCTANRSVTASNTKDLTVNVVYGPRSMSFSPAATSYREDEDFQFLQVTCDSQCWECEYSWTGPNSYSSSTAVLDLGRLTKVMTGDYICRARNLKSTQQPEQSIELKVEVRYGPDSVSVMPVDLNYTVDEGSTFDNITCSADCFPACSYRWTKEGQSTPVSVTNTLPLGRVEKSYSGRYTCTATNGDTQSKQSHVSVTINVRYGPYNASTSLKPSTQHYTNNEGTSFSNITCSADCYPACTYTWTKVRQGMPSFFRNGNVLSLGQLTRDEAAKYVCSAINPYKSESPTTFKEVTVNIRYGPDTPRVNVQLPINTTEGESVPNVVCSSECYPGCSFSWKNNTDNTISSSSDVLSLGMANRYKAGNYTCTARNNAQQYQLTSEKTIAVIVNYAPHVNVRLSSTDVYEGASLTLYCDGSGFPTVFNYLKPTQKWNDVLISNENKELSGTQTNSSIHFKQLQLQDTGTYTCALNNGIRNTDGVLNQVSSRDLTVEVLPKILKDELQYIGNIGDAINIDLPVYSFPDLESFTFKTFNGDTITSGQKYTITSQPGTVKTSFYGTTVSLRGHVIDFSINNLEEGDFGSYTLTITNSLGLTSAKVFVNEGGEPSPPKNFQILDGFILPTFLWEKGFNGGFQQTFVIQTSVYGSDQWINSTEIHEDEKHHNIKDDLFIANISGLPPTTYTARVFAYNSMGDSAFVYLEHTFEVYGTEKDILLAEKQNGDRGVIIGFSVGSVFIALYAVAVTIYLILYRRRTTREEHRSQVQSRKNMTYVNMSFASCASGNTLENNEEDRAETDNQYTSLDRNVRDEATTYDVINPK